MLSAGFETAIPATKQIQDLRFRPHGHQDLQFTVTLQVFNNNNNNNNNTNNCLFHWHSSKECPHNCGYQTGWHHMFECTDINININEQ